MNTDWQDKVIMAFVAHLAANGHEGLVVDSCPDKDEHAKGKKTEQAIDATAGLFAIEHTSIDTLDGQREANAIFMHCVGNIEKEVQVPFHLRIIIQWGATKKGPNYSTIENALRRWIVEVSPTLPCGRHEIDDAPDIPFALSVEKSGDLGAGIFFVRSEPADTTFGKRLRRTIERKATKLQLWTDHTRALLIESDDIALMSHVEFWKALREEYPDGLPQGVDQIWYADTCGKWGNYPARFVRMTNDRGVVSAKELP